MGFQGEKKKNHAPVFPMKRRLGVWLPDGDSHFERVMLKAPTARRGKKKVGTYQLDKLLESVSKCTQTRTALDIGAHVGFWSMWLVTYFQKVHAFEPVGEHGECFQRNVCGAELHPVAVGDRVGSVGIDIDEANTGKSHVFGFGLIPMITVDSLDLNDVDLIKIDVEGMEAQVIAGALKTIERCKPVLVVEEKGHHERYGNRESQSVEMLMDMGMRVSRKMGADYIMVWK